MVGCSAVLGGDSAWSFAPQEKLSGECAHVSWGLGVISCPVSVLVGGFSLFAGSQP
jgi:hypothetical protein